MGKKSFALGRGLGEVIKDHSADIETIKNAANSAPASEVSLDLIDPNPFQPRKVFKEDALRELAESIKTHGVLEPVLLRKNAGRYQIISGERRVRAARVAGLKKIEARVFDLLSDKTMAEWAIIENIQREDLDPIEISRSYQQLLDSHGYTHEDLASRLHKSRAAITNSLRLLKLPSVIQNWIQEGKLSAGAARSLLSPNISDPVKAAEEIIAKGLSVREAEEIAQESVGSARGKKTGGKDKGKLDPDMQNFLANLQTAFGTKISVKPSRKNPQKGTLIIAYNSYGDLTRIRDLIAMQGDLSKQPQQ